MIRIVNIAAVFALPLALLIATSSRAASSDESEFLTKAAAAGAAEVEAGRMAERRATDPAVQKFARQMVTDHSRINKQLLALAKRKGVSAQAKPTESQEKDLASLKTKDAEDFDQAYMDQMVADHKDAVSLFESAAKNSGDHEISDFASKTLKTLRHHAGMAKRVNKGQAAAPQARGPKH